MSIGLEYHEPSSEIRDSELSEEDGYELKDWEVFSSDLYLRAPFIQVSMTSMLSN